MIGAHWPHDLAHAEKTRPPPSLSATLLRHLPFFAYQPQRFSWFTPCTLNFLPLLVLTHGAHWPHDLAHAEKTRPPPSLSAILL